MHHTPRPQEIYRHFKGKLYQIVTVAEHSETGERLVIYQAMYGGFRTYARPLERFMDKVDRMKYPDAGQEYRFETVDLEEGDREEKKDSGTEDLRDTAPAAIGEECGEAVEGQGAGEEMPCRAEEGQDRVEVREEQDETEPNLDPMVLEFLDASGYGKRLNILAGLHHRITDDMINVMAMAMDIEVKPGDLEERYAEFRNCLMKLERFECNRLR